DIGLKEGNGLDLVRRIKEKHEDIRVLVWSMHSDSHYAERALRAGALGFITKDQAIDQVLTAIRRVLEGKIYLSEAMSEKLLHKSLGGEHVEADPIEKLSDRELEVFRLMGQALDTREIADRMHVSAKTVETYQARIKEKLNLDSGRELLLRAARWLADQAP